MIRFSCPQCASVIKTKDEAAGREAPCPRCGERLRVPGRERFPEAIELVVPSSTQPSRKPKAKKVGNPDLLALMGCGTSVATFVFVTTFGFAVVFFVFMTIFTPETADGAIGLLVDSGVIAALLGLGASQMSWQQGYSLPAKFRRLGNLTGRTKDEIVNFVGKPSAWSVAGENRELLQWIVPGYHICLIFQGGVCQGITHEFNA